MPAQGYYDAEFAPWAQGMRRIGSMIAAQPMMQANAQARQRDAELMAARTQTEGAQQGKLRAETMAIEQDTGGRNKLGDALRRLSANPKDPAALADAFEGTAQALRHDPDGTSKALGTLLGQMKALGGDVTGAADVTDPVAMEKNRGDNASKEKIASERGITLSPGAGYYDKAGNRIANQPSAASQAQASYETTTETIPASEGSPEVPADTGKRSLFGFDALAKDVPPTPGKPAVPPTHEKKITRRVLLGDAANAPMANQAQDPNDSEDGTDPGGPEEHGEPPVVHGSSEAAPAAEVVANGPTRKLTPDIAMAYLQKYGNRQAAEAAAKKDGYSW